MALTNKLQVIVYNKTVRSQINQIVKTTRIILVMLTLNKTVLKIVVVNLIQMRLITKFQIIINGIIAKMIMNLKDHLGAMEEIGMAKSKV